MVLCCLNSKAKHTFCAQQKNVPKKAHTHRFFSLCRIRMCGHKRAARWICWVFTSDSIRCKQSYHCVWYLLKIRVLSIVHSPARSNRSLHMTTTITGEPFAHKHTIASELWATTIRSQAQVICLSLNINGTRQKWMEATIDSRTMVFDRRERWKQQQQQRQQFTTSNIRIHSDSFKMES